MASLIPISGMGTGSLSATANWRGGVGGGSLVGHFRVVAVLPVSSVTDDLHATIGHGNAVLATDNVSIAGSLVRVIDSGLSIVHRVVELERHARLVNVVLRK